MGKTFAYDEIGARIRDLRGKDRQKDWATRIGCDQGYISQVENGVTKPSLSFLKGVATITNASIDWILTGRGQRKASPHPPAHDYAGAVVSRRDCCEDETLRSLSDNPKLLMGVERLLKMEPLGSSLLEAIGEMEEKKVAGLATLLGIIRE
ncbi:MAG: helix-turn-helix transcriptional regulator [Nitrospirae bacterium]|nr:helix-turn-helix transcriptional regulator [Nitrospirota bacterium]MBI5695054.1 helix-turn-helix transcriptional regulator [Nitrospirota bacterium]